MPPVNLKLWAVAGASLAVGAAVALMLPRSGEVAMPGGPIRMGGAGASGEVAATGTALIGGPFSLIDHTGRRVTERDFRGRHMLVFFGFTYCPDICPSGLAVMAKVLDTLGPAADRLAPLFVSVDPERDTPEVLARYVASFHPRIVGLTGTPAEVKAAAKAYRVYAKREPTGPGPQDYTIDHSTIVYLMGPDGAYRAFWPDLTKPDRLAADIGKLL